MKFTFAAPHLLGFYLALSCLSCDLGKKSAVGASCGADAVIGHVYDYPLHVSSLKASIMTSRLGGRLIAADIALNDLLWQEFARQRLGIDSGDASLDRRRVVRAFAHDRTLLAEYNPKGLPPGATLTECAAIVAEKEQIDLGPRELRNALGRRGAIDALVESWEVASSTQVKTLLLRLLSDETLSLNESQEHQIARLLCREVSRLDDGDELFLRAIFDGLSRVPKRKDIPCMAELASRTPAGLSPPSLRALASGLSAHHTRESALALVRILGRSEDTSDDVVAQSTIGLVAMGRLSIAPLAAALENNPGPGTGRLAYAAGTLGAPELLQPLATALKVTAPQHRLSILLAIATIAARSGDQRLIDSIENDWAQTGHDPSVVNALGHSSWTGIRSNLLRIVRRGDLSNRTRELAAIYTLALGAPAEAQDVANEVEGLGLDDREVRRMVTLLGSCGQRVTCWENELSSTDFSAVVLAARRISQLERDGVLRLANFIEKHPRERWTSEILYMIASSIHGHAEGPNGTLFNRLQRSLNAIPAENAQLQNQARLLAAYWNRTAL